MQRVESRSGLLLMLLAGGRWTNSVVVEKETQTVEQRYKQQHIPSRGHMYAFRARHAAIHSKLNPIYSSLYLQPVTFVTLCGAMT